MANRSSIRRAIPDIVIRDLCEEEAIVLHVCFVEKPSKSSTLSKQLSSYLALESDRLRKSQS